MHSSRRRVLPVKTAATAARRVLLDGKAGVLRLDVLVRRAGPGDAVPWRQRLLRAGPTHASPFPAEGLLR